MKMTNENKVGFIAGFAGGMTKAVMAGFDYSALLQVAIFALVSGFLGVAGKKLFEWLYKKIKGR